MKEKIEQLKKEYEDIHKYKKKEQKELDKCKKELGHIIDALKIAQEGAEQIQQKAHEQISSIVNKCLETIFQNPYEFKIKFSQKRNKTEADLTFIRNGREIKDVGGGILDVTSFALRLCSILFSQKTLRPVMLLDEPFKNVSRSKGYLDKIPEMMITLAEEFSVQFIQVTHVDELKIGKIIEL